jgi:hypothetical protein
VPRKQAQGGVLTVCRFREGLPKTSPGDPHYVTENTERKTSQPRLQELLLLKGAFLFIDGKNSSKTAFAHDPERLVRFEREAKVLAILTSPREAPALIMEWLDPCHLSSRYGTKLQGVRPVEQRFAAASRYGDVHRERRNR